MASDPERLQRLLGGAELAELRQRLRARYERGETRDAYTLTELSTVERRALEGLLGRSVKTADSMRVRQSDLDQAIARAGLAADLRGALEALDGPLVDRKRERIAREQTWRSFLARVDEPRLRALVSDVTGATVLKRFSAGDAAQAEAFLEQARRVLARLPARGVPRAQLAAEALGDAHALDAGRPVATLVLRACSAGVALDPDERQREQWARLGVTVNELARPSLCLNLPATGDTPGALLTRAARASGEPVHLSLRTLLKQPPAWDVSDCDVYVCENSAIVTIAADRLGPACAPLLCTDGMPSAAQQTLLAQLASCGARLHYHGDFDWEGIGIGNFVMRAFGARPWRFGAAEYGAACPDAGVALAARGRVEATWDEGLAPAMDERGVLVHEEAVVEELVMDLGTG